MARTIDIASITVPVGPSAFEVDSPVRANGAIITLTRFSWPIGPLFTWRIFERERNGVLQLLASAAEEGGEGRFMDGTTGAPLIISVRWSADKDRDRIRIELDVVQQFTAGVKLDWIA